MEKCIFIFCLSLFRATNESFNIFANNNSPKTSGRNLMHSPPNHHKVTFLNSSSSIQKLNTSINPQSSLIREKCPYNYSAPVIRTNNYFNRTFITNNSVPVSSDSTKNQLKFDNGDTNSTTNKPFEFNLFSSSNSNTNSHIRILYKDIENFAKNSNFKYIQKMHSTDSKVISQFYQTKFTIPLTEKNFLSCGISILSLQMNFHKNYDKLKHIAQILNLMASKFDKDYHNASLFLIYITFITRGFKKYVVEHNNDCIEHLLPILDRDYNFSNDSLINSIRRWKELNLKFCSIKQGYDLLVNIGLYFFIYDNHPNADNLVYSYKKFIKKCLEKMFGKSIKIYQ